jgi:hypothetical protein
MSRIVFIECGARARHRRSRSEMICGASVTLEKEWWRYALEHLDARDVSCLCLPAGMSKINCNLPQRGGEGDHGYAS